MGDEAMRRLARRAGDDPLAEARLLAARLRSGQLGRADLRLAAWLGHAPASAALGEAPFPPGVRDLQARILGLYDFGLPAALRAFAAAARFFLEAHEVERPDDRRPHEVLEALDAWLREPGETTAQACAVAAAAGVREEAADRVLQLEAYRPLEESDEAPGAFLTRSFAARVAPRIARSACAQAWRGDVPPAMRAAETRWARDLVEHGLDPLGVWEAIRRELLPSALAGIAAAPRPYAPTARFDVGDDLLHPTFGRGAVVEVKGGKVVVAFADGKKRSLAHAATR